MSESRLRAEAARKWFSKALSDLKSAKILYAASQYENAAFLCQQAAIRTSGEGQRSSERAEAAPQPKRLRRLYGTVALDPTRMARDASRISEEIVQHFSALADPGVSVRLEITAEIPGGAPDHVVRTVTENCRTLKFMSGDFEEN